MTDTQKRLVFNLFQGLPLIQPISQYQAGITDLRTTSPQSSQSHNSYCSPSRSLGMSSASVTLPAVGQTMSDIIYHPHMVVSGPTMIYSEPQSLNSMFFNLSQVSRQQQQQPSNGQQLQQNLILQQSCQQFGTASCNCFFAQYFCIVYVYRNCTQFSFRSMAG